MFCHNTQDELLINIQTIEHITEQVKQHSSDI